MPLTVYTLYFSPYQKHKKAQQICRKFWDLKPISKWFLSHMIEKTPLWQQFSTLTSLCHNAMGGRTTVTRYSSFCTFFVPPQTAWNYLKIMLCCSTQSTKFKPILFMYQIYAYNNSLLHSTLRVFQIWEYIWLFFLVTRVVIWLYVV